MAFSGFSEEADAFFKQLAVRQDRGQFEAHKADHERLWVAPMKELLAELVKIPAGVRHSPRLARWILDQVRVAAPGAEARGAKGAPARARTALRDQLCGPGRVRKGGSEGNGVCTLRSLQGGSP